VAPAPDAKGRTMLRLKPRNATETISAMAKERAAISLDREVFEGAIAHEDGALTLQLGGVELVIARRE
jgi:hypothetical protein